MKKLVSIAHISIDGFVAGLKGELDGFDRSEGNLEFVCKLTRQADSALFGRVSYQLLETYWPTAATLPNVTKAEIEYSNWYNSAKKIVVSNTITESEKPNTTIIRDNILDAISDFKKQEGSDILLFGSPTLTQFLIEHGMIDSYWIFIHPVFFGEGIPLFRQTKHKMKLKLGETKKFVKGEIALHYSAQ